MPTDQRAPGATSSSAPAGATGSTGSAGPGGSPKSLRNIRARVRALPGGWLAWRIGITVVGVAIIAGGIVLLPLPGPGWLIIFAGLGVLATEYTWAARLLTWARDQVRRWTDWLKRQPVWVRLLAGLVTLLVLAGVALAAWYLL